MRRRRIRWCRGLCLAGKHIASFSLFDACIRVLTTFAANWIFSSTFRPVVSVPTLFLHSPPESNLAAHVVNLLWILARGTSGALGVLVFVVRVAIHIINIDFATDFHIMPRFPSNVMEASTETSERNKPVVRVLYLERVFRKLAHEREASRTA